MTCWVVVPIKAPEACKTRLGGVLDDEAREALVAWMLRHVVATARSVESVDEVLLLGPSRHGLPETMRLIDDPGRGLNAALGVAAKVAAEAQVDRLVFVSADLPHVTAADISALVEVSPQDGAIAPDRGGTGTNALSLPGSIAADFAYRYGFASFAAHRAASREAGFDLRVMRSATLALDIDEPADLTALGGV